MLNRAAIALKPKQPMIDWINSQSDTIHMEAITNDLTLSLIPEIEMDDDFNEGINANWENLFEDNLAEWHTDPKMWPKNRTLEMFYEWFEILKFSVIQDLVGEKLVDDEA